MSSGASREGEDVLRRWQEDGINLVRFELPDIHGHARSKIVPIAYASSFSSKGLNLYGGTVCLDSASLVVPGSLYNEEVNYADQLLFPDWSTARIVPWVRGMGRVICDAKWSDGRALAAAPRHVLKRVLEALNEFGLKAIVGLEYEFYILDRETQKPIFPDIQIFRNTHNTYIPLIHQILDYMPKMGVDIITANCEYGPGQYEINYSPADALEAADRAYTFKNSLKELCVGTPWNATFMTKPFSDRAASGCHIHISLVDRETGRNAFLATSDPQGISDLCRFFVQGHLEHANSLMALMAPTLNCYRRFVPHRFAPVNVSWGFEDRSAMIRVKNPFGESAHVENRLPTALSNPYLVTAAAVAAGILGIASRRLPPEPVSGPAGDDPRFPPLARSLPEALAALEADAAMTELLGDEFVKVYTAVKRQELARYSEHITDWERNEYLENF